MLILRPTLKLAAKLKLGPLKDLPAANTPIADWCVRAFKCGRVSYLLFSNTNSLFSMVVPQRGVTNAKTLRTAFATAIHQNLDRAEHGQHHASAILAAMADCQFSRCHDRAVLSSINDLAWMAECHLAQGDSEAETIDLINQAPMGLLGMDNPARCFAAPTSDSRTSAGSRRPRSSPRPLKQEFHFKIEFGDFTAELAIGGDCSLYALAQFLIKTVGFDFDHAFQFCNNLKYPYRSDERYTLFADIGQGEPDDGSVKKTKLSQVFKPGRKMIFHFDYGDDWFFLLTCTAVKESTSQRAFKQVVATHGTPPEQYPGQDGAPW